MTRAEAKKQLKELGDLYKELPWKIGDAYIHLESRFGEKLPGLAMACGLSDYQLYDFVRMSQLWPQDSRIYNVPWSYYRDAGGDVEVAKRLLDAAVRNGWSRDQVRSARKQLKERMDEYGSTVSDRPTASSVEGEPGQDVRVALGDVSNHPVDSPGDNHP